MVVVWFAHSAPETLLGGIIYFMGMGNFGMFFAIVVVTRIAPIIGALFSGRAISPPSRSVKHIGLTLSGHARSQAIPLAPAGAKYGDRL